MPSRTLENRLRRALNRRGLTLTRSRRRDPAALDFGGYMILDTETNAVVAGGSPRPFFMTLADVEVWMTDKD